MSKTAVTLRRYVWYHILQREVALTLLVVNPGE
jgi:hypothetical protein